MIITYTLVDDEGNEYGDEVSFRFMDLIGVARLHKWEVRRDNLDGPRQEIRAIIPGCATIYVGRHEFNVKKEYEVVLAMFKEYHEFYERR